MHIPNTTIKTTIYKPSWFFIQCLLTSITLSIVTSTPGAHAQDPFLISASQKAIKNQQQNLPDDLSEQDLEQLAQELGWILQFAYGPVKEPLAQIWQVLKANTNATACFQGLETLTTNCVAAMTLANQIPDDQPLAYNELKNVILAPIAANWNAFIENNLSAIAYKEAKIDLRAWARRALMLEHEQSLFALLNPAHLMATYYAPESETYIQNDYAEQITLQTRAQIAMQTQAAQIQQTQLSTIVQDLEGMNGFAQHQDAFQKTYNQIWSATQNHDSYADRANIQESQWYNFWADAGFGWDDDAYLISMITGYDLMYMYGYMAKLKEFGDSPEQIANAILKFLITGGATYGLVFFAKGAIAAFIGTVSAPLTLLTLIIYGNELDKQRNQHLIKGDIMGWGYLAAEHMLNVIPVAAGGVVGSKTAGILKAVNISKPVLGTTTVGPGGVMASPGTPGSSGGSIALPPRAPFTQSIGAPPVAARPYTRPRFGTQTVGPRVAGDAQAITPAPSGYNGTTASLMTLLQTTSPSPLVNIDVSPITELLPVQTLRAIPSLQFYQAQLTLHKEKELQRTLTAREHQAISQQAQIGIVTASNKLVQKLFDSTVCQTRPFPCSVQPSSTETYPGVQSRSGQIEQALIYYGYEVRPLALQNSYAEFLRQQRAYGATPPARFSDLDEQERKRLDRMKQEIEQDLEKARNPNTSNYNGAKVLDPILSKLIKGEPLTEEEKNLIYDTLWQCKHQPASNEIASKICLKLFYVVEWLKNDIKELNLSIDFDFATELASLVDGMEETDLVKKHVQMISPNDDDVLEPEPSPEDIQAGLYAVMRDSEEIQHYLDTYYTNNELMLEDIDKMHSLAQIYCGWANTNNFTPDKCDEIWSVLANSYASKRKLIPLWELDPLYQIKNPFPLTPLTVEDYKTYLIWFANLDRGAENPVEFISEDDIVLLRRIARGPSILSIQAMRVVLEIGSKVAETHLNMEQIDSLYKYITRRRWLFPDAPGNRSRMVDFALQDVVLDLSLVQNPTTETDPTQSSVEYITQRLINLLQRDKAADEYIILNHEQLSTSELGPIDQINVALIKLLTSLDGELPQPSEDPKIYFERLIKALMLAQKSNYTQDQPLYIVMPNYTPSGQEPSAWIQWVLDVIEEKSSWEANFKFIIISQSNFIDWEWAWKGPNGQQRDHFPRELRPWPLSSGSDIPGS